MAIFTRVQNDPYKVSVDTADISGIANAVRSVPRSYINERGNNVTDECLSYIAPLIIGEPALVFEGGMPKHFSF
jgi:6-phosphofructokinase 1